MAMRLEFLFSLAFLIGIDADPRLLNAQVLFRHGDRTPTMTVPSDPYQESFWGLPWGTLTKEGMQQHLKNGLKLKARYIDQLNFIKPTWDPYEVYIQSALHDRCLQSAAADFAGFYSDSQYHPSRDDWPKNWVPMPIHTNEDPDHEFEPGNACPRVDQLQEQRLSRQEYLNYEQQHIDIVQAFAAGTGEPWTKWWDIISYIGCLICENAHNLTLPSFVTPQLFNDSISIRSTILDYTYGMASLQVLQDDEQIKLRTGVLMKAITGLFREYTDYKYYAYSVHDSTIVAILYALGTPAKTQILGEGQPGYASTLIFELWKMDDRSLAIKQDMHRLDSKRQLFYANTAEEELKEVTSSITGCQNQEYCPQQTVLKQLNRYLVNDVDTECQAK